MRLKPAVFFSLIILIIFTLYIDSTYWWRIKKSEFYKDKGQYEEAIEMYKSILRKDKLTNSLNDKTFSEVNFSLGHLYTYFGLRNLSIEHYAKASKIFFTKEIIGSFYRDNLDKDKLLAIGLLEAGLWDQAREEFRKLSQLYPEFKNSNKYIAVANDLGKNNLKPDNEKFLFLIGDSYIKNGLFDEARSFFSQRILDYGLDYMRVLTYLDDKYSKNKEVVKRIWGANIYVSLEDFESLYPKFTRWITNLKERIKEHAISSDAAYKGKYSEVFDLHYPNQGPNYWIIPLIIEFSECKFQLGIRIFGKNTDNLISTLRLGLVYPRENKTGIYPTARVKDKGDGWQEYSIENLYESLKIRDSKIFGWDTEGLYIDKIIWDTCGSSGRVYLDSIELYITN